MSRLKIRRKKFKMEYDFGGWATRNNLRCSDGRTIMRDAFKHNDGQTVPLVWNHQHNEPSNVIGHALLENRSEGVYAYCSFNDTESGAIAKALVQHGDIKALSIYANQLRQNGGNVIHGEIREVSLVHAGANPGAFIDAVMVHGEESEEEGIIYTGEELELSHADTKTKPADRSKDETVEEVFNTLTEKQKTVVYALIGQALEDKSNGNDEDDDEDSNEEDKSVKHNVFENDDQTQGGALRHSDEVNILNLAKSNSVGSLQDAIGIYMDQNDSLAHGFDSIDELFPEYKDVRSGAPEFIERDQGWVTAVMQKVHKSPISRIRTRQMDIRDLEGTAGLRGYGYSKRNVAKTVAGNAKLLKRTTDPQTVYRRDALHRDDIIDITDFDVVEYQYKIMRQNLNEEIATAIMIGDGRDDADNDKISEEHIRSIWHDADLYSIKVDVDIDAARQELQGSSTAQRFGDNYIYAEAIINSSLYAREHYKGSGKPDFFCTPHLLNVMLLARDYNGRRIYSDIRDLEKALNVGTIYTAEQFEGKTRTTTDNKTKKLLGIFVNLNDYQVGSTKGGEITRFNQFDIDFNKEKYLIETRLSGALTRVYSAIVLEEPIVPAEPSGNPG